MSIDCTAISHLNTPQSDLPDDVRNAISDSLSENTKRAYSSDLIQFENWGGTIPTTSEAIAAYLVDSAKTLKSATLMRKVASLSKAHRALGIDDPCKHEIVRSVLRGIRRQIGTAQRQAKPLLKEDLFAVLSLMGNKPKDIRDKSLLLLGFAGALRRSELVGLDVEDIETVQQGLIINLRKSKTDQTGLGRKIGIPFGRTRWCPVKHLDNWLATSNIDQGPLFRSMAKSKRVSTKRLSGEAVSLVIKQRAQAAGFDPELYSGHSLRSGLATSAVIAGASTFKIREITGHASDTMLQRYVRDGSLFEDNAVGYVL